MGVSPFLPITFCATRCMRKSLGPQPPSITQRSTGIGAMGKQRTVIINWTGRIEIPVPNKNPVKSYLRRLTRFRGRSHPVFLFCRPRTLLLGERGTTLESTMPTELKVGDPFNLFVCSEADDADRLLSDPTHLLPRSHRVGGLLCRTLSSSGPPKPLELTTATATESTDFFVSSSAGDAERFRSCCLSSTSVVSPIAVWSLVLASLNRHQEHERLQRSPRNAAGHLVPRDH